MRRISIRLLSVALGVSALVLATWNVGLIRSWRIKQTKPLADGISMRIEDVYITPVVCSPTETHKVLWVKCRYLGGSPLKLASLRAALFASPDSPPSADPRSGGYTGISDDRHGGTRAYWEFRDGPEGLRHFVLRVYCQSHTKDAPERYVDFTIPYLPKLTPHGAPDA